VTTSQMPTSQIIVPKPRSNCFGCSPLNPSGLQLQFSRDAGEVTAEIQLDKRFESYPGVIHGGIVATVLDEAMGTVVRSEDDVPALTLSMRVRYSGVVRSGEWYRVLGRVISQQDREFKVEARLTDAGKRLVAYGEALFRKIAVDELSLSLTRTDV
jgi:acyl-coenzyme A thioesterase PaaI-like protein